MEKSALDNYSDWLDSLIKERVQFQRDQRVNRLETAIEQLRNDLHPSEEVLEAIKAIKLPEGLKQQIKDFQTSVATPPVTVPPEQAFPGIREKIISSFGGVPAQKQSLLRRMIPKSRTGKALAIGIPSALALAGGGYLAHRLLSGEKKEKAAMDIAAYVREKLARKAGFGLPEHAKAHAESLGLGIKSLEQSPLDRKWHAIYQSLPSPHVPPPTPSAKEVLTALQEAEKIAPKGTEVAMKGLIPEFKKLPSLGSKLKGGAGKALIMGGSLAGLMGAMAGGKYLYNKIIGGMEYKKNFSAMMEHDPSLRDYDPAMVEARFRTLHNLNPTYSKDPLIASSWVAANLEWGPHGSTPAVVKDLLIPKGVDKGGYGHGDILKSISTVFAGSLTD